MTKPREGLFYFCRCRVAAPLALGPGGPIPPQRQYQQGQDGEGREQTKQHAQEGDQHGMLALAARQSIGHDTDDDHQQPDELPKQGGIEGYESSFFMAKAHSIATEPPDKSPI